MGFPETADIETSSDGYASRFAGVVGEWFLKVQEEATLRMLAPFPKASVLDVGGGHGQLIQPLVRNGCRVTVLGSSEQCKTRIQSQLDAGTADFRVGNILELPYDEKAFDVVISYRLLAHVTQWREFLAEMTRVAGAAVILDYPEIRSINSIGPYLFHLKKSLEKNTRKYACFHESDLLEVFDESDFRKSEKYPQFFLPMAFHRALKMPSLSRAMERFFRLTGLTGIFGSPVILKVERVK